MHFDGKSCDLITQSLNLKESYRKPWLLLFGPGIRACSVRPILTTIIPLSVVYYGSVYLVALSEPWFNTKLSAIMGKCVALSCLVLLLNLTRICEYWSETGHKYRTWSLVTNFARKS